MSSDGAGLTAGWAVWGKRPHSPQGFQVMAAWPPEWNSYYTRAVQHWSPGTPSPADRLPWVTVGPSTNPDHRLSLGVFVLDRTETADVHSRPINHVTHFWVPYEEAAGHGLGWSALARAALAGRTGLSRIAAGGESGALHGPVRLPLSADEHLMNGFDEEFVSASDPLLHWHAAVAALLLDGPVVVTGAPDDDPLERLRLLDNIAAMLPYALRTCLSAATATSSGANHRIRLSWGRSAPGRDCVPWGGAVGVERLSAVARQYHDLLIHAWESRGGHTVLDHLARCTALPEGAHAGLPTAQQAHRLLCAMDHELHVEAEVLRGGPVADDVVDGFLRDPRTNPRTGSMMARAKLSGTSTDLSLLPPYLSDPQVADSLLKRLREDLRTGPLSSVQEKVSSLLRATRVEGTNLDVVDRALAVLVDPGDGPGEDVDVTATLGLLPSLEPFPPGTMPLARGAVAARPELTWILLEGAAGTPEPARSVRRWLEWLGTGAGDELALLYDLLRPDTTVWQPQSARWAAKHPDGAARLLGLGVACGRGDTLLTSSFFDDLSDALGPGGPGRVLRLRGPRTGPEGLRATLAAGPRAALGLAARARWDLLCALAGEAPSALPDDAGTLTRPEVDRYADTLKQHLDALSQHRRRPAAKTLLRCLLRFDPATGRRPGAAARAVAERLVQEPTDAALRGITAEAVSDLLAAPGWRARGEEAAWLDRLAQCVPQIGGTLRLYALGEAARDGALSAEEFGRRLRSARCAGATRAQLCGPLAAWADGRPSPGTAVLELLDAYREAYRQQGDPAGPEQRALLEKELWGRLGGRLWTAYFEAADAHLLDQEESATDAIRRNEQLREEVRRRRQALRALHFTRR
ncbi:hypothetical protein [Streptomyces arenae]|uniref:hypothetical protein n=1 Tax=Streptomyces arenae TaxID=29301 RepID=UPI002657FEBD|nr:hypothetical protein [Streptomyces arenae]MCG7208254.1 hypothetical protein [Streptomyces arenae]